MGSRSWRPARAATDSSLEWSRRRSADTFNGQPGRRPVCTVQEPRRPSAANAPSVAQRDQLKLGFFQRLFTPADERALVDGLNLALR